MNGSKIIRITAILGALAVGIGAFGAHGLKETLISNGRLETFETAVNYHFYHVLALLAVGLLAFRKSSKLLSYACIMFIAGIFIFSGSLYVLSITNITFLGAITPIGGVGFIAGWLLLFWSAKDLKDLS